MPSVWREKHGDHVGTVTREGLDLGTGSPIPEAHIHIVTGGQELAIGAEGSAMKRVSLKKRDAATFGSFRDWMPPLPATVAIRSRSALNVAASICS